VTRRKPRYLTVALYHPRVMKGGAQYVAKDLHDCAAEGGEFDALLLAGIDGALFPQHVKVGSAISALPETDDEYILAGSRFDDFYHTAYDPRRVRMVARFLGDHRPDVIHIHHSLWVGLEFIDLARKIVPDAKILYTLHEYLPICYAQGQLFRQHERAICRDEAPDQCATCFPDRRADEFILRKRAFQRAFAGVDYFIAPSSHLRDRFVRWGIAEDRITVIPNGHRSRRPAGWKPQPSAGVNIFGYFGQFVDAKGIDVLLHAARAVAESGDDPVEVRIFGGNKHHATAEYLKRIDAALDGAPAHLRVTEMGPYSRENVFDLMSSVDWVVVPSVWPETFGLVVSEAWDARRPVIASRAGGLGERIVDGRNGLGFAPGSVSGLAQIMRDCIGNTQLWTDIAKGIEGEISLGAAWSRHVDLARALGADC